MKELIGISMSPWSEKAKWALEHHHIPFRYHEHLVMFGMPALRLRTREFKRELTVPILLDGDHKFFDSFDIAEYSDRIGTGSKLFPDGTHDQVRHFNSLSEKALDAGRATIVHRIGKHPDALIELLPPYMSVLGKAMLPVAKIGVNYISDSFGSRAKPSSVHFETLREVLLELRRCLKAAGGPYLLGEFSYADVTMAVVLHFVRPAEAPYVKFGPAARACWTDERLVDEFKDLVAWRDELYQRHRRT